MFETYLFPISYAFLTFPVAALLFTLPFLVVQYRRHGYINKIRALILYLLLLYLMNAFYLVLLPLPPTRHNAAPTGPIMQYIPLQFIQDIFKGVDLDNARLGSYLSLLRQPSLLLALFNVALTVPFGMFLRYYFRTRWVICVLLSFLLSLSFEITQVTGIFGFYDHPYRLFDVDDLITNTLGGLLGYRIAIWISGLLPRIEKLDTNEDLAAKRVTYTRRLLAFMIDGPLWSFSTGILYVLNVPGAFWLTTGIYFMLIPLLTKGRTLGKWIVRIHVQGSSERYPLWGLIIRYGLLYWVLLGLHVLLLEPFFRPMLGTGWGMLLQIVLMVMDMAFLIHLVAAVFKKELLFYERLSRTAHNISWPDKLAAHEAEPLPAPPAQDEAITPQ
ncbi:VanZ family protein [Paenibacillus donghaensis]|uniref:Teicoplanin resistance protein VanZ n=1 Tax=Paenibacillus donghaensis TaxID=414771 RepID=A0A2Z2KQK3_9BACL|nr:VanZ family protein [Paenibacillus donghaensis]ASA21158.1 teicoplanin resistance protein VanZ [Paenibacillus donghaensis]